MKFENTEVFNFEGAIRGMRMPFKGTAKCDSKYCLPNECEGCPYYNKEPEAIDNVVLYSTCAGENIEWIPYKIGQDDMRVAQRLVAAGSPHNKFLRQILVSMDITASIKWWAQMDQYKVGTVTDSESVMHSIAKLPITMECFESGDYNGSLVVYAREPYNEDIIVSDIWEDVINHCETLRQWYNQTKDIRYWNELIRLLPESYLQTRTWTGNYAVLRNIIQQRSGHKLHNWQQFIEHCRQLPYAEEFLFYKGDNNAN